MNIYCGNLSYNSTDEELDTLFTEYGSVASAKVIVDRETNRSRGFGFVEMDSDEEIIYKMVLDNKNFIKYLEDAIVTRKIYVPNRLVNIVTVLNPRV